MSVLQFRQRPVKGTQPKPADRPRYFCKKCAGDLFLIMEDGSVNCPCGSFVKNLRVWEENA